MTSTDSDLPIAHWSDIENPDGETFKGTDEARSINAAFGAHFGLERLGIHHERLLPGRRTSFPHAESAEEEFVYVLEGEPDVWLDGRLHRLKPGDGVGFPAGTGLAHSFLNNTETEVRLLVVGETAKAENRIVYPVNLERKAMRDDWWDDHPRRPLGDHDGLPDRVRASRAK
ncbi:cupin domain-containing protein [Mesorhizobium sp. DCY119]|uniref:cupin domain-containing protein n=1 Tax=Mesorhizobium sp. DCY119 TaxID=2108445 RepID=UPI000E6B7F29|nr:cupin domain-containing protein [Mesorhizobium sp. DCY119]RJG45720.1 cupin domain-containing protein [Mesorhizobium sp. DCY119]